MGTGSQPGRYHSAVREKSNIVLRVPPYQKISWDCQGVSERAARSRKACATVFAAGLSSASDHAALFVAALGDGKARHPNAVLRPSSWRCPYRPTSATSRQIRHLRPIPASGWAASDVPCLRQHAQASGAPSPHWFYACPWKDALASSCLSWRFFPSPQVRREASGKARHRSDGKKAQAPEAS